MNILQKLLLGACCAMTLSAGFTSCSDDDDDDSWKDGSTMDLPNTRAYILNEGSQSYNNSKLVVYDWSVGEVYSPCIYSAQNGKALGDVANDLVKDGDNMLVAVNGSNYVALLNGSGVEKARVSFEGHTGLGTVRDVAVYKNNVYVTSYGGYVSRLRQSGSTFIIEDSLEVGSYPEDILVKDGTIYCTVSGWGSDNRVAVIDAAKFEKVSYIDVMLNPDNLAEEDGHLFVQGYGPYDASWNCPYPWGEINTSDGTYTELGYANAFTTGNGQVYTALSVTDWTTYTCNTTLTAYDIATGTTNASFFKNAPAALATSNVYGLSVNPYDGSIYVCTTDFSTDGTVYCFDKTGQYTTSFSSNGVNPKTVIFFRN